MSNSGEDDQDWLGVVAASRFLGVHRSTLHLAVHQQQIVPDRYTPGGHLRFRRATLEAFRARQTERPGSGASLTPLHALEELARLAVATGTREDLSRDVLQIIRQVHPAVDICFIAWHSPTERDPWSVRMVAHHGITADMLEVYRRLRPSHEFATTAVIRTGMVESCVDTQAETVRHATDLFTRQVSVRSYVVLPLMGEERPVGALGLMSRKPHAFSAGDRLFVTTAANQVAAALISADRVAAARSALLAAGDLMIRALEPLDQTSAERPTSAVLADLVALFQAASGAEVVCTFGFEHDVSASEPRLWELARRACELRSMTPKQWGSGQNLRTGVAVHVPLPGDGHAAVAAAWKGARKSLDADHTLLAVLAGACVLASSRLGARAGSEQSARSQAPGWPD